MPSRKTAAPKRRKAKYAYQLLVTLVESEPTVWRQICQIVIPGNMTLADLDRVIQTAMGWTNSHLHQFTVDGRVYGEPDDEFAAELPTLPDGEFTLDQVIGTTVKSFIYEYDFGDSWEHDVKVQMVMVATEDLYLGPMCLAGANACPPEDVGGIPGYAELGHSRPIARRARRHVALVGRAVRSDWLRRQLGQSSDQDVADDRRLTQLCAHRQVVKMTCPDAYLERSATHLVCLN
ncbi:plasmid pRiA4b ORF-3 family protein [Piscinibacter sakaiensis]|uniref:plasmid pRiA4b ORF-3 family protein n=1 Tax=Piscinibacter sakaiensis TaxID=1547922 RepID=UPI003AB07373